MNLIYYILQCESSLLSLISNPCCPFPSSVHGAKKPFRLEDIWGIRTRLQINDNPMQLALLNLAIDSKLRSILNNT